MKLAGFYAVIDRDDRALATTLARHATALQVRIKPGDAATIMRVARMAREVCDELGVPLVVNDRVDIALAVRADAVHLGQTDLPLCDVRRWLSDRLPIGVSTHNIEQVERAVAGGANYLGFGPVFATRTKLNPDPVQGLEGLRAAVRAACGVPIVAIGGISPGDAAAVYSAGAQAICAISAVNDAYDVAAAARALATPR